MTWIAVALHGKVTLCIDAAFRELLQTRKDSDILVRRRGKTLAAEIRAQPEHKSVNNLKRCKYERAMPFKKPRRELQRMQ